MGSHLGKIVALVTGVTGAAVVVTVAFHWNGFRVRHHFDRLREEPGYLYEILSKPDGTSERKAVDAFVKSAQESGGPFRAYLAEMVLDDSTSAGVQEAALDELRKLHDEANGNQPESPRKEVRSQPSRSRTYIRQGVSRCITEASSRRESCQ